MLFRPKNKSDTFRLQILFEGTPTVRAQLHKNKFLHKFLHKFLFVTFSKNLYWSFHIHTSYKAISRRLVKAPVM